MGIFDKLQHKLFGTAEAEAPKPYAPTNTEIVDHIFEVFKRVLVQRSVDDDIYFDTVFVTKLPTTVAKDVITMAPGLATTIVKRFYKELRLYRAQGKSIVPVANYWQFAFVMADPMDTAAQQELQVLSFITDPSNENLDLIAQAEMGQVSINGEHSMNGDINAMLLRNVDVIERGKVRLLISPQLELEPSVSASQQSFQQPAVQQPFQQPIQQPIVQQPIPPTAQQPISPYAPQPPVAQPQQGVSEPLAQVTFLMDGKQMVYKMRKPYLIVGRATPGEKATIDRLPIASNEPSLLVEHFYIRYDAQSRSFSVATRGTATLGDMPLPVSPSEGDLLWTPLRQESTLVFGLGHISFKALC